ncbi:MAG: ABC transporter permease [Dehalococcoidia bacterium]
MQQKIATPLPAEAAAVSGPDTLGGAQRPRAGTLSRLARNHVAMVALTFLLLIYGASLTVPIYIPAERANQMDLLDTLAPPSAAHPFGTDEAGRDVFVRALYGGRISLTVGIAAAALQGVIGIVIGAAAGYCGGRLDALLMRVADLLLGVPFFFVLILVASFTQPSLASIILVIGLLQWVTMARLVRSELLSLKEWEFVIAARAVGSGPLRITFRQLLPNAVAPIIVQGTLAVAFAILAESAISFLGLGIQPPTPSWGNMLTKAQGYLISAPWLAIFPGGLIFLTVLSFNLLGDALRDALDPKLRS